MLTITRWPTALIAPHNLTQDDLAKLFQAINKRQFSNRVTAQVRWQVPEPTPKERHHTITELKQRQAKQLNLAKQRLLQRDTDGAIELLKDSATQGSNDARRLLCRVLQRMGDRQWKQYAEDVNQNIDLVSSVPASDYLDTANRIILHPLLANSKTPKYVLRYLIFNLCREHFGQHLKAQSTEESNKVKTNKWLTRHGFPAIS